jgi:hypothetical protein
MTDTAAEYRKLARQALIPGDGMRRPSDSQVREADVHAHLANSAALDRIADALEALAATTALADLQPVLHHSH